MGFLFAYSMRKVRSTFCSSYPIPARFMYISCNSVYNNMAVNQSLQSFFLILYIFLAYLQKTHAYHRLQDDVPVPVKQRRLEELISVFREEAAKVNMAFIGSAQLVLVEGVSITLYFIIFCLIFSTTCRVAWGQKNTEHIWYIYTF